MATIHGHCDDRFEEMSGLLSASIDSGADIGASVAVTLEGEMVVDIWGGWVDVDKTAPWSEHTITNVWSTTKTMTALAALVLVAQGELDVYAPVAKYWPEFAANGKESIEVRHLLSHTSGVSAWEQPITTRDIYDFDTSVARLATQAPWWKPGTASGYHMLNYGHVVGGVIQKITGQRLGEFFRDHVAGPLRADFHIGLPPEADHRVSNVIPPPPRDTAQAPPTDSPAMKTFIGPPLDVSAVHTEGWRRADIGAANGHGNARSVALLQALVANEGEANGVRLLDASTCNLIFDKQSDGVDIVIGYDIPFGIGYGLVNQTTYPHLPQASRVCQWGGYGGSSIIVDLDRRMTIAYVMNRMENAALGEPRSWSLITAAYAALDQ